MSQTIPRPSVRKESLYRYLYVAGSTGCPIVKIGIADCPRIRLHVLRIAADDTLVPEQVDRSTLPLLHQQRGSRQLEQALHRYFAHRRVLGEWFDLGPVAVPLVKSAARDLSYSL